jgi:hypothetical protein
MPGLSSGDRFAQQALPYGVNVWCGDPPSAVRVALALSSRSSSQGHPALALPWRPHPGAGGDQPALRRVRGSSEAYPRKSLPRAAGPPPLTSAQSSAQSSRRTLCPPGCFESRRLASTREALQPLHAISGGENLLHSLTLPSVEHGTARRVRCCLLGSQKGFSLPLPAAAGSRLLCTPG